MQLGPFRFAPPWWGILVTIVGVLMLCSLGVWQIQRAHYKEHLLAQHAAAERAGPQQLQLDAGDVKAGHGPRRGYRYIATGHYDDAHQLLLADQVHGTEAGYRVWTPLVLDSGVRIMVDRGWVPKNNQPGAQKSTAGSARRSKHKPDPAAPGGRVSVPGYWRSFPQPGLTFGTHTVCDRSGWPRALSYPTTASVRCQYPAPVADGLLLLNPKAPGGFLRHWEENSVGLRPWVHYSYSAQWFLMALAAVVVFGVVNVKRR